MAPFLNYPIEMCTFNLYSLLGNKSINSWEYEIAKGNNYHIIWEKKKLSGLVSCKIRYTDGIATHQLILVTFSHPRFWLQKAALDGF